MGATINFDELISDGALAPDNWEFKNMEVGCVIAIDDRKGKTNAQIARHVHAYAKHHNKRFKTKTSGGVLYVKRTV